MQCEYKCLIPQAVDPSTPPPLTWYRPLSSWWRRRLLHLCKLRRSTLRRSPRSVWRQTWHLRGSDYRGSTHFLIKYNSLSYHVFLYSICILVYFRMYFDVFWCILEDFMYSTKYTEYMYFCIRDVFWCILMYSDVFIIKSLFAMYSSVFWCILGIYILLCIRCVFIVYSLCICHVLQRTHTCRSQRRSER